VSSEALPPRNLGWSARKPPPQGDGTEPPKKRRYWWKFTIAAVLIVGVAAAATASSIILFLGDVAAELRENSKHLSEEITPLLDEVDGGGPETILFLGSDKRAGAEFAEDPGRSDTTMLVRLDPEKGLISVLSIPRDLKVEIPGFGTEKFNAAYTYGGPKLTLRVVKELTGLKVNHVVNIDFLGFVRAVDAIGCVYVDVDRRYYHSNAGLPPSEQYAEINIQPGYQKLCGKKALQYVRYRHTDTDIVRSARQQGFMSQARKQVGLGTLLSDQERLAQIFTEFTTSDIGSVKTLLQLIDLVVESRNSELNQVHFPAELGPSYVYASQSAIHHAVREFLGQTGPDATQAPDRGAVRAKQRKKHGAGAARANSKKKRKVEYRTSGSNELVAAGEAGYAEGKVVARRVGGGFPVFYPTRLPPGAAFVESDPYEHLVDPRVYHLKDKDKERHAAYRMVGVYQPEYETTYFGIQGIRGWEDPPILADPTETREIHGREYDIYGDSGRVALVAWHRGGNTYWISNSLENALTNDQMIGIARSAKVILPKRPKTKPGGNKR
jgi:LCP family protein required for cell wall assembly